MMGIAIKALLVSLVLSVVAVAGGAQRVFPAGGDADAAAPSAVNGRLTVDSAPAAAGGQKIALQGQWEFYRSQLLEPQDWQQGVSPAPAYMAVPSSWGDYGYGTYRLLLQVPDSDIGQAKALFIRSVGSAYRLWIDGREKDGLGTVGTSLETEQPQSHINLVFFQPGERTVEIVLQVSNYSFRVGGISRDILYGDTGALIPYILKELSYDIFVMGGFFMIGLYHIVIYAMRKKDAAALWVGALALSVSLRTLFINGYLSALLLRIESWELLTKLEYTSELCAFLAAVFLMKQLYPRETNAAMVRLSWIVALALFVFVALTPARIYTETMLWQTVLKAVILLYFVFYVGVQAYLRKREGALIHVMVLVVIFGALVNDTLYYLRWADTIEVFGYSIVPFIVAQAIIVSYRHARLSFRNDMLLEQTNRLNDGLEHKVAQRTESLREANTRRTKMLVNIAHDLGTPLVGIQTYLQLMARGRSGANSSELIGQLLDSTGYMKRLVDDLFELSKLESGGRAFQFERTIFRPWFERMFHKFEADLLHEGITLRRGIWDTAAGDGREAVVSMDPARIAQVLQNYIDNAVKFSRGLSEVIELEAYVRRSDEQPQGELVAAVRDYGSGITEEAQPQVFERFYTQRENNEGGSGLGLAIVKEIIERHGGTVGVSSTRGAGSTFYLVLPLMPAHEAAGAASHSPESEPEP